MTLVSVIVPARNEEGALHRSLGAVAAQNYPHELMEVVVVDGDSSDRTAAIAADELHGHGYCRSAVLNNPTATTPTNLNIGLDWSAGDLVVRVDARSNIPPDYIERMVSVMADESIAVAGGSQVAVERSDSVIDRSITRALNNRVAMGGARYRRAGATSGTSDTAYLGVFRREQLEASGGWNPAYPTNQDFELNQRMLRWGSIWFEAGLPVGYIPRSSIRDLGAQYQRFGRWKATYWMAGRRPRARQWLLLAMPTLACLLGPLILWFQIAVFGPIVGVGTVALLAAVSTLGVDALGGHRESRPIRVRALAGALNLLIGAAWYAGVVTQLARRTSLEPPAETTGAGGPTSSAPAGKVRGRKKSQHQR